MLKKILFLSTALLLSACSHHQEAAFPAEYANADYVLSESDAQKWVRLSHQAEQCVYPNLTRIQRDHFSKEDAYIHSQYVFFYPLEQIIGEQYVKIMQGDDKSMGYATYLFKKYKDLQADPLDEQKCQALRTNARDDLAVVKGEYKNGMVSEKKATDSKEDTGVATNDNKFFFDIIKWGTALLL